MKTAFLTATIFLALLLTSSTISLGQKPTRAKSSSAVQTNKTQYYLDIARPNCCNLTDKEWQQIAATLKKAGVPAFFGLYETLNYGESWRPMKLRKTASEDGWLMLGPFASASLAEKTLYKLPRLLPKHGDTFRGVESDSTSDSQTWQIGMYQISGSKTAEMVAVQKPKAKTTGVIDGKIVEIALEGNWYGIYVESGGIRYLIQLGGNSGGVEKTSGEIDKVGNRVRVTYLNKEMQSDGAIFLYATSVVQLK